MAPRLGQASRQRQILTALLEQYRRLLEQILGLRELLKGSFYELKTRCGKPSCHCASPDGRLPLGRESSGRGTPPPAVPSCRPPRLLAAR